MAVEPDDAKFISKLDEACRLKAKEELNEINDKDRELAVQSFRQWILEQDWLTTPTDFGFLLKFLRVRKYSQLGARETLKNYWTVRSRFPEWFKHVDPTEKTLEEILRKGIVVCPKRYDKEGRRVLIDRTAQLLVDLDKVKATWGLKHVYRALLLVQDWVCSDENVQVNGIQKLYDGTKVTLNAASTILTGVNGRGFIKYNQKAQPARVKRINVYNEPVFITAIAAFVTPFMTEKMRNRVKFHGNSMVSVYKDIDKSLLPTEYLPDNYTGPSAGPLEEVIDDMLKDMKGPEFRRYIQNLSNDKYGVDLSKIKQDDQPAESFRKLHSE